MKLCIASFGLFLVQCLIGAANADCAPVSGSLTLKTSQDVTTVSKCTDFTGNIVVAADGPEEIALDGIHTVTGNIDVENVAQLRSLSSNSLEVVQSLTLMNLPKLSNLSFPALSNFSSLQWKNLPSFEHCAVAGTHNGEIQEITVTNTSLKSMDWLVWPVQLLNITENASLETFSIPYNSINTGSSLTFSDNAALANITVSQLSGIYGGLQVSGNNALSKLSFEAMETIGGYVQLSGDFKNVSMPALNSINGGLNVQSTGDITALCINLQEKASSHVLKGHYDCTPNVQKSPASPTTMSSASTAKPTSPTITTIPTPSPSPQGSGLSIWGKVGISVTVLVIAFTTLALTIFYFRRRNHSKVQEIQQKKIDSIELADSDAGAGASIPKELESPHIRLELAAGKIAQELPAYVPHELLAKHGSSELHSPTASFTSVRSDVPLIRHELPG